MAVAGPFPSIGAPPMVGVAPPPVGPRVPNPKTLETVKDIIKKLFDAIDIEQDPILKKHTAKCLNPVIKQAIRARHELSEPPKPVPEEAEDAESGPLDRTPGGLPASGGGNPIRSALPRLMGITGA